MKSRIFVIAEIGVNHNGSMDLAKKLVTAAREAGADAVKFQTYVTEEGITAQAPKPQYQKSLTDVKESQFEMIKRLEFKPEDHPRIMDHCKREGVQFMSTACDLPSAKLLGELGVNPIKIASCDIVNIPLLRAVAPFRRRILLSTGMATLGEIENAVFELRKLGTEDIVLMVCTTEYPCPFEEIHLNRITTLRQTFELPVGFSDHSEGIGCAIASVALGAAFIERHFTLDRNWEGPDHRASLTPVQFAEMTKGIREVEKGLGLSSIGPTKVESKNRDLMRRKLVTRMAVRKGEKFSEKNIGTKRAEGGLIPSWFDSVVGRVAERDYGADEVIHW